MKNRKKELDVDFIGGGEPLTEEEKKAINDYFSAKKGERAKSLSVSKKRIAKRGKSLA